MGSLRFVLAFCPLGLWACVSLGPTRPPPGAVVPTGGRLAVDPNREPYRPRLPPGLHRAGLVVAGTFRVCAAADGRVMEVSVIKSADPRVDEDWMKTLKTWRYEPFVVAGNPLPLCHKVRLDVRATS